jgi:hypothetical protein
MKKFVFASVLALASVSLLSPPAMHAQDSDQITIKDPTEYNAYTTAITQTDAKAQVAALETFLQNYPQSVVKKAVLVLLLDTYFQKLQDPDHTLSAASRVLQLDPSNSEAILFSVVIKKSQCQHSVDPKTGSLTDPQPCDDAVALAQKGLTLTKPAGTPDADWKKYTDAALPIFHSTIATASAYKKDFKTAIAEYRAELMLYTDDQSKTAGLSDTLQLAQAYVQPGPSKDLVQASWFYARVWDYAPDAFKGKIEPELERWYKKYHGGLDGLDDLKKKAAVTTFPPGTFKIDPAKTPAEQIHATLVTTTDWNTLALEDKETVLAVGSQEDRDKLWALMKDKQTPVPGVVISATASVINIAVTADAKDAKIADFVVNLKTPLADKEIPKAGDEFKLQPAAELDATYDSYTQIPATDTSAASAQIVLKDGSIQEAEKKKPATPAHKPSAAHHTPAAH